MFASGLCIEQVGLPPDHALIVISGVLDRTAAARLATAVAKVLGTGARYLVADLSQVTQCDPAAMTALAGAARRLSRRGGWLRLVATSPAVVAALDTTDVRHLVDLYHAHNGTRDTSDV